MNFWRVSEFVRDEIPEFDKAADDFVRRWESEIKPKSIEELKRLGVVLQNKGVKAWRMPVSEVADRIYFNFTKTPIGDTRTLSNLQGNTDDLRQSFEEELLAQQEDISPSSERGTQQATSKSSSRLCEEDERIQRARATHPRLCGREHR